MSYSPELKVKSKHLTAEAQIIRKEERKHLKAARWLVKAQRAEDSTQSYWHYHRLRRHRVEHLRPHARLTHIAHALVKGQSYTSIEQPGPRKQLTKDMWKEIDRMIKKYSPGKSLADFHVVA